MPPSEAKPMKPMPMVERSIDPRGIIRLIIAVEEKPEATYVTKDCGHRDAYAQHFTYRAGHPIHCFACGQEARDMAEAGR